MEAVAGALAVAAFIGTWRWLTKADNRDKAKQYAQQRVCRHDWEPIPPNLVGTDDREWCVKCDARR